MPMGHLSDVSMNSTSFLVWTLSKVEVSTPDISIKGW
jgi:hypothetical protein